jgi:hypothetical protein
MILSKAPSLFGCEDCRGGGDGLSLSLLLFSLSDSELKKVLFADELLHFFYYYQKLGND